MVTAVRDDETPLKASPDPKQPVVHPRMPTLPPETPSPILTPSQPSDPYDLANLVGHYDSQKLDQQIREIAAATGRDAETIQLPLELPADVARGGTQAFRMLGIFLIVGADGNTVYLPDDL